MKLNLIPTYVSKEGQSKVFMVLGILIFLLSCGAAFGMIAMSQAAADAAYNNAQSKQQDAANAVATANFADDVVKPAAGIDKNIKLARAMNLHSSTYPDLYDEVLSYVPSFMRVTAISAAPTSADGVTVTLSGILSSFQQYADANLALLRIPNVTNVVRSDYELNDRQVPNLVGADQIGAPVKAGEEPMPSDPWARFEETVNRANAGTNMSYQGLNGFGDPDATTKGAGPNSSPVTFVITLSGRNLQAPNPRATIEARGGAPTPNNPPRR